jgi:anti-sigma B factor antagonist
VEVTIVSPVDGVAVAAPVGRLDLLSAAAFKGRLAKTIAEGQKRLVIDMGQVTFLDSSGLGALIGVLKSARQAGGDMRIAGLDEQARIVLELTTLDRVLTPYASVDEAMVAYG